MATIRVERPHDGGAILRRLAVEIDSRQVAALKQGESADIAVTAGTHAVVGRLDWTSTPDLHVEVAEGQQVRVEVAIPFSALWNMVLRPRSALSIQHL